MTTYHIEFFAEYTGGESRLVHQVDLTCDHLPSHIEIIAQRPPGRFSFYSMESLSPAESFARNLAKETLEHAIGEGYIDDSPGEY